MRYPPYLQLSEDKSISFQDGPLTWPAIGLTAGRRPLVLSTWTSPRAVWVSPEVEQVTHKSIYDPTSKATPSSPLGSIYYTGQPRFNLWKYLMWEVLEAGMITMDFPVWATEHSIAPKNPECLEECTCWQRGHAILLSKWYFHSTSPSFLLSLGGTILPTHGYHGNHPGFTCPWLPNHGLLVRE